MQDIDPKHTSRLVKEYLHEKNINWRPIPPESPDLNPIESMWHELKEFLRQEVKPCTKANLVKGIEQFWDTVTGKKVQEVHSPPTQGNATRH